MCTALAGKRRATPSSAQRSSNPPSPNPAPSRLRSGRKERPPPTEKREIKDEPEDAPAKDVAQNGEVKENSTTEVKEKPKEKSDTAVAMATVKEEVEAGMKRDGADATTSSMLSPKSPVWVCN